MHNKVKKKYQEAFKNYRGIYGCEELLLLC